MVSQKTRNLLAGVIAMIVAVGAVIIRRVYDLGPVASLSILAFLTALLVWQQRNRSPYRDHKDDWR
jgi:hypothetical protein